MITPSSLLRQLAMGAAIAGLLGFSSFAAAGTGAWSLISPGKVGRHRARAVTLSNGKILFTGGQTVAGGNQDSTSSCEIFDPTTQTFATTSSLGEGRYIHCIAALQDGRVLVAGGTSDVTCNLPLSCQTFNTTTGVWTYTDPLAFGRSGADMLTLPNGKVLLAGGGNYICGGIYSTCLLFDPAGNSGAGVWNSTGSMINPRMGLKLILLNDGTVLAIGGRTGFNGYEGTAVTEIYKPSTGTWSATTGSMLMSRGSYTDFNAAAVKLNDGRVFVCGGNTGAPSANATLSEAEIYNPATGTWSAAASMNQVRELHEAALLSDGRVLVAGGQDQNGLMTGLSLVYDPAVNAYVSNVSMQVSQVLFTLKPLANGTVLAAFGAKAQDFNGYTTAEIYNPATVTAAEGWERFY